MANTTKGRHLRWEAADTTGISSNEVLRIVMLAWLPTNGTNRDIAADDKMQITDGHDVIVLDKQTKVAHEGIEPITWPSNAPLVLSGIKVPELDGGELFITVTEEIGEA